MVKKITKVEESQRHNSVTRFHLDGSATVDFVLWDADQKERSKLIKERERELRSLSFYSLNETERRLWIDARLNLILLAGKDQAEQGEKTLKQHLIPGTYFENFSYETEMGNKRRFASVVNSKTGELVLTEESVLCGAKYDPNDSEDHRFYDGEMESILGFGEDAYARFMKGSYFNDDGIQLTDEQRFKLAFFISSFTERYPKVSESLTAERIQSKNLFTQRLHNVLPLHILDMMQRKWIWCITEKSTFVTSSSPLAPFLNLGVEGIVNLNSNKTYAGYEDVPIFFFPMSSKVTLLLCTRNDELLKPKGRLTTSLVEATSLRSVLSKSKDNQIFQVDSLREVTNFTLDVNIQTLAWSIMRDTPMVFFSPEFLPFKELTKGDLFENRYKTPHRNDKNLKQLSRTKTKGWSAFMSKYYLDQPFEIWWDTLKLNSIAPREIRN